MKDRMDFLQILSLLIAGAFLITAITPVSASADADRQTRLTSILEAHGASDLIVGHDTPGTAIGTTQPAWPARGMISPSRVDRDALIQGIRSGPGIQPVLLPDSGFSWPVVREAASRNRSTLMDDLIGKHQGAISGISRIYSGEGTVRFIDLEGGFYGIVTSSGERFIPDNLPRALLADGITIRFTAMIGNQEPGITMWGRTIHLISSEKIDRSFSKQGTVRYIDLEGGFYGIITPTGEKYLPMNLAPEFRVDGLPVEFTARERQDISNTAMWGIPVELISIRTMNAGSAGQEVLLEFSRNGGFAGCSDHLILYEDGSARVSRKEYTTLVEVPEETLDRLVLLLALVDGTDLQDEYRAPQEGADFYSYSLTYGGKTIRMEETAVPGVLVPVIDLLTDIIVANAPDDVSPPLHS
jgi:hypothetical protein